jgi:hypothetical protein
MNRILGELKVNRLNRQLKESPYSIVMVLAWPVESTFSLAICRAIPCLPRLRRYNVGSPVVSCPNVQL